LDNLTHSLVGLFLARAGLRHSTPRGVAIMVLAANAPDFDAVCWFGGPASYIHWHRNITHSIIAIPLMAIFAVAVARWAACPAVDAVRKMLGRPPLDNRKDIRWLPAWLIAIAGVVSHLILDLTNVYGVRLLLPFSGRWFHWDLTPVIDLAIWAMLLLGVVAPAFGRLVGSEIGERRQTGGGGWAVLCLLLLSAYDYGRSILHDHAVALMDSRIYHQLSPRRTGAFPDANPLLWKGIAELSDSYVEVPIDLREDFRPESGVTYYKSQRTAAVEAALRSSPFQAFLTFVQYPIWISETSPDEPDSTRVRLVDLRFGTPPQPGFQAIATVDKLDRVISSVFTFGQPVVR
jgi:inner membrane protein